MLGGRACSTDFLKMELLYFATAMHTKMTFLAARAVAAQEEMDQILDGGVNWEKNGQAEFCTHTQAHACAHAWLCQHLQPVLQARELHWQQKDGKSIISVFVFRAKCNDSLVEFQPDGVFIHANADFQAPLRSLGPSQCAPQRGTRKSCCSVCLRFIGLLQFVP